MSAFGGKADIAGAKFLAAETAMGGLDSRAARSRRPWRARSANCFAAVSNFLREISPGYAVLLPYAKVSGELVWVKLLKSLALPRGLEPLFSP